MAIWGHRVRKLKVLDLFSGIGGFSLGLERTGGFETVAFCEINSYCQRVLAKHWPSIICFDDVRKLNAHWLREAGINTVDVICGGFPCQDISNAGKRVGIGGERSGLWSEYARLIGELRPRFVIVENVAALLGRGLSRVLGDLAALGYDAEWHCIPASAIGAPHRRDRIWIIAHPQGLFQHVGGVERKSSQAQIPEFGDSHFKIDSANSDQERFMGFRIGQNRNFGETQFRTGERVENDASDTWGERIQRVCRETVSRQQAFSWCKNLRRIEDLRERSDLPEPLVCRVNDGISERLDSLGNAVVPQIPEILGYAILEAELGRSNSSRA